MASGSCETLFYNEEIQYFMVEHGFYSGFKINCSH